MTMTADGNRDDAVVCGSTMVRTRCGSAVRRAVFEEWSERRGGASLSGCGEAKVDKPMTRDGRARVYSDRAWLGVLGLDTMIAYRVCACGVTYEQMDGSESR